MLSGSAEPVIAGALVFLCLLAGAVVVGAVVTWRRLRRRWRQLRNHSLVRGAGALLDVASTASWGRGGRSVGVDLRTLTAGQARWQMWRSVGAAERSVREAAAVGAPTADLPSLCRRLHGAAEDVDRLLTMGRSLDPASPGAASVRRQVAEVASAAERINGAAVAAASGTLYPQVEMLTADAQREVTALTAALHRAGSPPAGY